MHEFSEKDRNASKQTSNMLNLPAFGRSTLISAQPTHHALQKVKFGAQQVHLAADIAYGRRTRDYGDVTHFFL